MRLSVLKLTYEVYYSHCKESSLLQILSILPARSIDQNLGRCDRTCCIDSINGPARRRSRRIVLELLKSRFATSARNVVSIMSGEVASFFLFTFV